MNTTDRLVRQGDRLIQLGMLLFLFALLVGIAVPKFAVPGLGLSTHLLGIMQGLFLIPVYQNVDSVDQLVASSVGQPSPTCRATYTNLDFTII